MPPLQGAAWADALWMFAASAGHGPRDRHPGTTLHPRSRGVTTAARKVHVGGSQAYGSGVGAHVPGRRGGVLVASSGAGAQCRLNASSGNPCPVERRLREGIPMHRMARRDPTLLSPRVAALASVATPLHTTGGHRVWRTTRPMPKDPRDGHRSSGAGHIFRRGAKQSWVCGGDGQASSGGWEQRTSLASARLQPLGEMVGGGRPCGGCCTNQWTPNSVG